MRSREFYRLRQLNSMGIFIINELGSTNNVVMHQGYASATMGAAGLAVIDLKTRRPAVLASAGSSESVDDLL
jgi:hypothetical protein|tara:strand:- start:49 stop:264 length:216 start_codon:yes stop_codon:yes gene_type:complete